jgi:hypothetical protein
LHALIIIIIIIGVNCELNFCAKLFSQKGLFSHHFSKTNGYCSGQIWLKINIKKIVLDGCNSH